MHRFFSSFDIPRCDSVIDFFFLLNLELIGKAAKFRITERKIGIYFFAVKIKKCNNQENWVLTENGKFYLPSHTAHHPDYN
jgi:hypothetical protein